MKTLLIHFSPLLLILLVSGCDYEDVFLFSSCDVEATITPSSGLPGDEVMATGGPFTEVYDTTVNFDGIYGEVTSVNRFDCELCDSCREDVACLACGPCEPCESACETCAESMFIIVPKVEAGVSAVTITNGFGTTNGLEFDVVGETTTTETGITTTTGSTDTGVITETANTGASDAVISTDAKSTSATWSPVAL